MIRRRPPLRTFKITFEGEELTFSIQYDAALKRLVVNGPKEDLDKEATLRARKAAVGIAKKLGYLDAG